MSDLSTNHFLLHFLERQTKVTIGEARGLIDMSIEWQGNPISSNKSFRGLSSLLCMHDSSIIPKYSQKDPTQIFNASTELYGGIKHKYRFHNHPDDCTALGTDDERNSSERLESTEVSNTTN